MVTASALRSRLLLGLGLLVGGGRGATAQTAPDTTRLKYGEEVALPPPADATLRVQQERRSLWKLGLNNVLPSTLAYGVDSYYYYARYGLHLAYERKLRDPAWSVLGEVSPALVAYRAEGTSDNRHYLALRAQAAGRYYYNRERRLRRGRSMGNFSANYVSLALGAGLGKEFHETPSFFYQNTAHRLITTEMAVLYGLQRRLGRYGFVDANVGVATLLINQPLVTLAANVRVGLTLGPQPPKYVEQLAPASEVTTLQPTFYAGAGIGGYFYQVRYSTQNPYPAPVVKTSPTETQTTTYPLTYQDGYGSYAQYVAAGPIPYLYAGYYLRPRLALQLGFQYGETLNGDPVGTVFTTPDGTFAVPNQTLTERGLAVPLLVRYALTPSFLRRLQFNAVGGVVPVWSMVRFQEYSIVNRQVTSQETFGFQRRAFGLHATLGFDASYAFGRRRRLEATAEVLLNKEVQALFQAGHNDPATGAYLAGGSSFGLRYRFRYR